MRPLFFLKLGSQRLKTNPQKRPHIPVPCNKMLSIYKDKGVWLSYKVVRRIIPPVKVTVP